MTANPFDAAAPADAFATPLDGTPAAQPLVAAKVVIDNRPGAEPVRIGAQVFISGRAAPVTTPPDTRPELDQP